MMVFNKQNNMTPATDNLGIWIDQTNAHLTIITSNPMITKTFTPVFTRRDKVSIMAKSEALAHHKEQHE
jgi:hypothetical protein